MSQSIFKGIKFPGMEDVFIAPDHNNMIHTTITKISSHKDAETKVKVPRKIYINCHNLTPGRTYTVKLYTKQRRRSKSSKPWRFNPQDTPGQKLGYESLFIAQNMTGSSPTPIPDWMPNKGVLQTTWTFTAEKNFYRFELPLETWLLDLLKPTGVTTWSLLDIQKNHNYSKPFQFRIYDPVEDYEGESKNTLLVSKPHFNSTNNTVWCEYTAVI